DADLAHAAAQHLAEAARAFDFVASARDHRADGRAQTLGETGRHGVERRRELALGDTARDGGGPDARAVEAQRQAARAGARPDRLDLGARPHATAAAVVRVLDRDQARAR